MCCHCKLKFCRPFSGYVKLYLIVLPEAAYLGVAFMQVVWFIVLSACLGDCGGGFIYTVLVKRTYLEYLIKVCFAVGLVLMGCLFSGPLCHPLNY